MGNLNLTRRVGEAIRYSTPVGSFDVIRGVRGRVDIIDLPDDVRVYRTELIDRVDRWEIAGFVVNLDVVYNQETGEIPYVEVVSGRGFKTADWPGVAAVPFDIKRGGDLARQLTGLIRDDVAEGGEKFEALRDKCRGV